MRAFECLAQDDLFGADRGWSKVGDNVEAQDDAPACQLKRAGDMMASRNGEPLQETGHYFDKRRHTCGD
jgi:hypothetical protein